MPRLRDCVMPSITSLELRLDHGLLDHSLPSPKPSLTHTIIIRTSPSSTFSFTESLPASMLPDESPPQEGLGVGEYDDGDEEEEEEEEGDDRSLDLLVKFVDNVFKKASRRARKAVRSVLPRAISTELVVCTIGSAMFVAYPWYLVWFILFRTKPQLSGE